MMSTILEMAVACGNSHTLLLDDSGVVWGLGSGGHGQLGILRNCFDSNPKISIRVPVSGETVSISCGSNFSVCVNINGQVEVFGDNSRGNLGVHGLYSRSTPIRIPNIPPILQAASGDSHTLLISQNANIYGFGCNSNGQLGIGGTHRLSMPVRVPNIGNVKSVACGGDFSLFLTYSGNIYSCGTFKGYLEGNNTPFRYKDLPEMDKIACGEHHALCMTSGGDVYSFGFNDNGQLGLGKDVVPALVPCLHPTLLNAEEIGQIVIISCGKHHSMFINVIGEVWMCGLNNRYQLGVVTAGKVFVPIKVPLEGVYGGTCGSNHTIVKNEEGVWGWGSNSASQLGVISAFTSVNDENVQRGRNAPRAACQRTPKLLPPPIASKFGFIRKPISRKKSARK